MNWGATSGEARMSKANGSLMRASPCIYFTLISTIYYLNLFIYLLLTHIYSRSICTQTFSIKNCRISEE